MRAFYRYIQRVQRRRTHSDQIQKAIEILDDPLVDNVTDVWPAARQTAFMFIYLTSSKHLVPPPEVFVRMGPGWIREPTCKAHRGLHEML